MSLPLKLRFHVSTYLYLHTHVAGWVYFACVVCKLIKNDPQNTGAFEIIMQPSGSYTASRFTIRLICPLGETADLRWSRGQQRNAKRALKTENPLFSSLNFFLMFGEDRIVANNVSKYFTVYRDNKITIFNEWFFF